MNKQDVKRAVGVIRFRQAEFNDKRKIAVHEQRWSHVAGFDGIATGLMLAARIVEQECKIETRHRETKPNS